jgi:AsmA-like C-terminal region
MRLLKRILIVFSVLLVLILGTGIVISSIYEEDVKSYMLSKINERLNTRIDVKEINFSVLKKFPYASLEFNDVSADEVTKNEKKGTLFSAQSVYLQFNIIDIINKNYIIKKINVENGLLNIKIDKKGNNNYQVWKAVSDSSNHDFNLALNSLQFKNFTFYTLNEYKNLDFSIEAKTIDLTGNFSEVKYKLTTTADLFVNQFNEAGQSVMKNKPINVNTTFSVNQEENLYEIEEGELSIENLSFNLIGNFKETENGTNLNLKINGNNIQIEDAFSLFPESEKKKLLTYKSKGVISFESTITGELSAQHTPGIEADFEIKNGTITEGKSNISLSKINTKGSFSNGKSKKNNTTKLSLSEFNSVFGAGKISGNYTITNFTNPYIEFNSEANIDLNQARDFFKIDTLETATGLLDLNINYSGYIKELNNIQAKDLQKLNAKGNAELKNADFKLVNHSVTFEQLNGAFQFNNNNIEIDSLNGKLNGNKFNVNGKFNNLLAFIFLQNEPLTVYGTIEASKLVLDELLLKDESATKDSIYTLSLPNNITFNCVTAIDTFTFRRFKATDVKGHLNLSNSVLSASNVSFKAMKGQISNANFVLNASELNRITMTSSAQIDDIDINQLFFEFENFGQEYFVQENIKGRATSTIQFASLWDSHLKLNKDLLYVLADLTIKNGELIDYKPILAMSKYIEVDELQHIKFSNLSTQIEIKNQLISIPKTFIRSSALDVDVAGTHSFDNKIDYQFRVLMSDVIWRKAKSKKKENTEFGYIEDDREGKMSLYLRMTGTVDDYKIGYDSKGVKEKWKQDLKEEKKTVKQLLNNEFGWFKNDSTVNETKDDKPKDSGLQIEWEEDEDAKTEDKKKEDRSTKKEGTEKTQKKKKGLGKLIDKIAQPDEEEFEDNGDF